MKEPKKRIYIYPFTARGRDDSANPYILNLARSLQNDYSLLNLNDPSESGILQMYRYFFRTDIVMFNWIENIPERKGGLIQIALLGILLRLYRISGKMIIWTMHNKISHSKKNYKKKKFVFKMMLNLSNLIITHSREGIRYGKMLNQKHSSKIGYIPHPVNSLKLQSEKSGISTKNYDFIIWGSMVAYKGVHNFLGYLKDNGFENDYSILIIGKFADENYYSQLVQLAGKKTKIENRFADMDELLKLVKESHFVLFTYSDSSVLSSGALMDTLTMGAGIIGPDTGAFSDLAEEGIIRVYKDFKEIKEIYNNPDLAVINTAAKLTFLKANTWEAAGKKIGRLIVGSRQSAVGS